MSRQRSAIPQPTPARLARIATLTADQVGQLSRVCRAEHPSPWWFSTRTGRHDAAGRFDLVEPHGTCYWSDSPLGALFERFTDPDGLDTLAPASILDDLAVWHHTPPPPHRAADTASPRGGLPKEFGAGIDYAPCWAWADALHGIGFDAVVAWSRMAPHATKTVAIFGTIDRDIAGDDEFHSAADWTSELIELGIVEQDPLLAELQLAEPE